MRTCVQPFCMRSGDVCEGGGEMEDGDRDSDVDGIDQKNFCVIRMRERGRKIGMVKRENFHGHEKDTFLDAAV